MNDDGKTIKPENVIQLPVDFQDGRPFALSPDRLLRIKMRMTEIDMDQAGLSNASGLSNSAISQIMTGKIRKTRHLPAIAKALGVNISWILAATDQRVDLANWKGGPVSEDQLPDLLADAEFAARNVETIRTEGVLPQQFERKWDAVAVAEIDLTQASVSQIKGIPVKEHGHLFSREILAAITSAEAPVIMVAQGIGDAMAPLLGNSDLVFFDTSRRALDCLDAVWLMRYAGMLTVRRARKAPDGLRLMADAPNLPDILAAEADVEFLGKVAGVIKKV